MVWILVLQHFDPSTGGRGSTKERSIIGSFAMIFRAVTLDDALNTIVGRLLKKGEAIRARKGKAREFTGVLVELSNPRARFSRTEDRGALFSYLGETLWYLSGSDCLDHIEYYIPKYREFIEASRRQVRAPGAYGPRLFGGDDKSQMAELLAMLTRKKGNSDTRQAVAQVFARTDLKRSSGDVPCTTTLQFLPRRGRLHMIATMRSNDVYRGFPGDVFAFTFIQELVAATLGMEMGTYKHFIGSLHLYDEDRTKARAYLDEGFQTPMGMPAMPTGDPWSSVAWLLKVERSIRLGEREPDTTGVDSYWQDLARLLRIKLHAKNTDVRRLVKEKGEMTSPVYDAFIRGRQVAVTRKTEAKPDLQGSLLLAEEKA